jgi:hypothetical protein
VVLLPVRAASKADRVTVVAVSAVVLMRATVRCAAGVGAKCRVILARDWCAFCQYTQYRHDRRTHCTHSNSLSKECRIVLDSIMIVLRVRSSKCSHEALAVSQLRRVG